mmetsp:Transcript_2452/g.3130  ORF Transcript_2452/g.3130 Transcript_2452/m.3130 type:complete len:121 (+) Transcript_2452:161-523(+)
MNVSLNKALLSRLAHTMRARSRTVAVESLSVPILQSQSQIQSRWFSSKFIVHKGDSDACFSNMNRALLADGTFDQVRAKVRYEKPAAQRYKMKKSQKITKQKQLIKKLVREAILQKEEGF